MKNSAILPFFIGENNQKQPKSDKNNHWLNLFKRHFFEISD